MIGIISDTHGLLRPEAIERLRGVTHIVHAGDTLPGGEATLPSARAVRMMLMSRVVAHASLVLSAPPDRVLDFLRDYRESRPRILPDNYTAYRVEQGGRGEGTIYAYHFTAARRERDYRLHVTERTGRLEEQDQGSSFVSTWAVEPSPGGSTVTIESSWEGAGGVGGFFEKRFAPRGLHRIYADMLARLSAELGG